MAPTVRVISALGVGAFGRRVAADLPATPAGDLGTAFASRPDVVVVALWRPSPALCDEADRMSFGTGTPWLPVILDHPVVRIGPWIAPPAAPCFDCCRRRRAQHTMHGDKSAMLHEAYDRDPALGPSGFLPHHARATAATVRLLLRRVADLAGRVVTLQPDGPRLTADPVAPMPGCARCGPPVRPRDPAALFGLGTPVGAR
ncbi:TOMM precursor leader peptide-binding protein [Actinoplanes sp. NPDC048796]|uniref:TOMM precursor leader peptide-binding protein n=1 Tax=Actinoplanes sp. NPDC048796 TaxID=3155640 RepID=UPI0033D4F192